MWFIALIFALLLLFYLYVIKINDYWKNKGVLYSKPLYLFGNFASKVFCIKSVNTIIEELYAEFPESRYSGIWQFRQPVLLIRDLELIKQITIKDFDVFPEHKSPVPPSVDPYFGKNLFSMSSKDGWHEMRATLSPSFTSSKMKTLFTLMQVCSEQFINYFREPNGDVMVQLKDAFTRYTNDVIGTSAFGITCDSLKNRNNDFYLMGKKLTDFSGIKSLKFSAYAISSTIMEFLKVRIVSKAEGDFFRSIISKTLAIRKQQNIFRPDMLHLLIDAQKKKHFTDEDLTAQALVFFTAGFETVSTALTFVAYELAINPSSQQKLYHEICTALEENSGIITYEVVTSMKYLDNVLAETLRMYPVVLFIDRVCVKPYTIPAKNPSEKPLHLEKGSVVWIPANAIHHDEKYFENPKKFDPDRFNDENKHKIQPFTYMPFGHGPRNCIGARFALLEMKLLITQIVQHFEIVPNSKTSIPLKSDVTRLDYLPADGIWVTFKPRTQN